jgi:hypothetical protein
MARILPVPEAPGLYHENTKVRKHEGGPFAIAGAAASPQPLAAPITPALRLFVFSYFRVFVIKELPLTVRPWGRAALLFPARKDLSFPDCRAGS